MELKIKLENLRAELDAACAELKRHDIDAATRGRAVRASLDLPLEAARAALGECYEWRRAEYDALAALVKSAGWSIGDLATVRQRAKRTGRW